MAVSWSSAFRRSELGAAVFDVSPAYRGPVLGWAAVQDVPTVRHLDVHRPAVEAWAVLDGGVTSLDGYGVTSLPGGVRLVGFRALRLAIADLELAGPLLPLNGETMNSPGRLCAAHHSATDGAVATEQAELLATCHDAVLLRWVAATLLLSAPVCSGRACPGPDQAGVDIADQADGGEDAVVGVVAGVEAGADHAAASSAR